jgi:hypothetical protein
MARVFLGLVIVAVLAFTISGCSKAPPAIVPVQGVVLLDNQPLPNVRVRFAPKDVTLEDDLLAEGVTDENGRFQLICKGQPGACACENLVMVIEGPMTEKGRGMSSAAQGEAARYAAGLKNRPIPKIYATASKTPLSVFVTPGRTEYNLELRR